MGLYGLHSVESHDNKVSGYGCIDKEQAREHDYLEVALAEPVGEGWSGIIYLKFLHIHSKAGICFVSRSHPNTTSLHV